MLQLPLHLCSNFTYCPRVIWVSSNSVRLATEAWGLYSRPVGFPSSQRAKHYYIYAPTSTPSVRRPPLHLCSNLIYCPRVTRAASNSASHAKEAVDPSLASGEPPRPVGFSFITPD